MIAARPRRWRLRRALVQTALSASFALAAFAVAQTWLETRSLAAASPIADPAAGRMAEVLVTARNLEAGDTLVEGDLRWQAWPVSAVLPGWEVRGRDGRQALARHAGQIVPVRLPSGVPVTAASLAAPGSGSRFAAAIGAGQRAATIAVSPAAGLAGFVAPGDRVDVLLVQTLGSRRTAQTLLRNLGVLGVDQRQRADSRLTAPLAAASDAIAGAAGAAGAAPPGLVTLEVTPAQAEALAVAAELGKLSLVLRGPGNEAPGLGGRQWDTDVTGLPAAMMATNFSSGLAGALATSAPPAPPMARQRGGLGQVDIVYGLSPRMTAAAVDPSVPEAKR